VSVNYIITILFSHYFPPSVIQGVSRMCWHSMIYVGTTSNSVLYSLLSSSAKICSRDCSNDDVLSDPETLAEIIADITLATNAPKKKAKKKKSKAETNEEEENCRPAKKAKKAKKKAPVKSEEVTEDDDDTSDDSEKGDSSSASSASEQQWVGCDR